MNSPSSLRSFFGVSLVRRLEHPVLQLVSFGFSFASAHAIQWFLSPLNNTDPTQFIVTIVISSGLGLLGYFITRGLADRLMNKESVLLYLPLLLIIEFTEIFTNFAKAQVAIQDASWLVHSLPTLRLANVVCTYVLYSIVPLIGPCLAVLDMDLTRRRARTGTPVGVRPVVNNQRFQQPPQQPPRQYGAPSKQGQQPPQAGGAQNPPGVRPQPAGAPV